MIPFLRKMTTRWRRSLSGVCSDAAAFVCGSSAAVVGSDFATERDAPLLIDLPQSTTGGSAAYNGGGGSRGDVANKADDDAEDGAT